MIDAGDVLKGEPFVLAAKGLRKSFAGVEVLHGVDITARGGRVLALLGENGAGKSTVVKILAGDYQRDDGEISVNGEAVALDNPAGARAIGVRVIFQEFMDAPDLSVAENIGLGSPPSRCGFVRSRALERQARVILDDLGAHISPRATVGSLGVAERQIVEIARAFVGDARLLVLDEPTSALGTDEVEALFRLIRGLRSRGVAIVYITHRLDELEAIADDVVVFRDGEIVKEGLISELTTEELITAMVGEQVRAAAVGHVAAANPRERHSVLELRSARLPGYVENVDLTLGAGEILALYGRLGCGAVELAEALFGLRSLNGDIVLLAGEDGPATSPASAISRGIGFVPVDRKLQGILQGLTLYENLCAASWGRQWAGRRIRRSASEASFRRWQEVLDIAAPQGAAQLIETLSGGNQQKIILARWLEQRSRLLVLAEPTRGVDVGARAKIYEVLRTLADEGVGILVVSSDVDEVIRLADRVIVMNRGRVTAEYHSHELSKASLAFAASSGAVEGRMTRSSTGGATNDGAT